MRSTALRRNEICWWGFQVKFKKNLGYVRCGPTLVALNLMGNFTGTDSLSLSLCCPNVPVSLCLSRSHCSSDGWWGALGEDCPEFPLGAFHPSVMDHYSKMTDRDAEAPHIWGLASHCFQEAVQGGDQIVVMTGESGVSDP